jgi:hypothetical protein
MRRLPAVLPAFLTAMGDYSVFCYSVQYGIMSEHSLICEMVTGHTPASPVFVLIYKPMFISDSVRSVADTVIETASSLKTRTFERYLATQIIPLSFLL